MRSFKILAASAMLIVGILALNVTGAQAQAPSHSGACVFTGVTGDINPDPPDAGQPTNTGIQNIMKDVQNPGPASNPLADFDDGGYTFDGDAQCTLDGGAPAAANIVSAGRYVNQICGTGTADGNAGGTTVTSAAANANDLRYHIDFRSGQGVLDIRGGTLVTPTDPSSTIDGNGEVSIEPTVGNCVNADVEEYTVEGGYEYTTTG